MEITNFLEYSERSQLREWLMANHAEAKECKNSHWTETNIRRCAELEKQGLMTDAGRKKKPSAVSRQPSEKAEC